VNDLARFQQLEHLVLEDYPCEPSPVDFVTMLTTIGSKVQSLKLPQASFQPVPAEVHQYLRLPKLRKMPAAFHCRWREPGLLAAITEAMPALEALRTGELAEAAKAAFTCACERCLPHSRVRRSSASSHGF
jgi:hypothetical protein